MEGDGAANVQTSKKDMLTNSIKYKSPEAKECLTCVTNRVNIPAVEVTKQQRDTNVWIDTGTHTNTHTHKHNENTLAPTWKIMGNNCWIGSSGLFS